MKRASYHGNKHSVWIFPITIKAYRILKGTGHTYLTGKKLSILTTEREDRIREMAQVLYKNNHNTHAERLLHTLPQENLQTKILLAELYIKTQRPQKAWNILSHLPPKIVNSLAVQRRHWFNLAKVKKRFDISNRNGSLWGQQRVLLDNFSSRDFYRLKRAIMEASMLLRKKNEKIFGFESFFFMPQLFKRLFCDDSTSKKTSRNRWFNRYRTR